MLHWYFTYKGTYMDIAIRLFVDYLKFREVNRYSFSNAPEDFSHWLTRCHLRVRKSLPNKVFHHICKWQQELEPDDRR